MSYTFPRDPDHGETPPSIPDLLADQRDDYLLDLEDHLRSLETAGEGLTLVEILSLAGAAWTAGAKAARATRSLN